MQVKYAVVEIGLCAFATRERSVQGLKVTLEAREPTGLPSHMTFVVEDTPENRQKWQLDERIAVTIAPLVDIAPRETAAA